MIFKKIKNQKGISLYLGIIILSLIFAISLMVSDLFLIRFQLSRDILSSVSAFYGADSALECAQMEIAKQTNLSSGISCSNLSDAITNACGAIVMSNGADVEINDADVVCTTGVLTSIKSAGSFKNTKRSAEVDF